MTDSAVSHASRVAITGATGFIGRHLGDRFAGEGIEFRNLSRQQGTDLRIRTDVERALRGCDAVVNLADSSDWSDRDTDVVVDNLAAAALVNEVRRVVHLSTAAVVGRCDEDVIDERTECRPTTAYEIRKLRIEQRIEKALGGVDLVILRPTLVFGAGGANALKLAQDLRRDPGWKRNLRWSLLRRRRMNLVAVGNVVEAIVFVLARLKLSGVERFIVADDDDPSNNYGDIAAALAPKLGIDYRPMSLPLIERLLPLFLRLRGRSLTNPHARFSSARLWAAGYRPVITLAEELDRFAASLAR